MLMCLLKDGAGTVQDTPLRLPVLLIVKPLLAGLPAYQLPEGIQAKYQLTMAQLDDMTVRHGE